jgi:hypothetical protein
MSAPSDMARLLQQWRQMTKSETAAIHAAAWPRLKEIQSHKALLRTPLKEALAHWRQQQSSENRTGQTDLPFRAEVNRLIALEAHNAQLVAERCQKAAQHKLHLERARRNLGKVRHSYAPHTSGGLNSWS